MFRLQLVLGMLMLLAASALAAGPKGGQQEETALRKLYAAYDAAWNGGDSKRLAAFWTDNARHVEPDGSVLAGRTAIEEAFARRFSTDLKGTQSKETVESIQLIKSDVAVVDAAYEVIGAHDAAGQALPPLHGRYVDVWVKKSGKWQIATDRPLAPVAAVK